ncbi:MAG: family 16 glycoside hydrolase [Halioglobus sp.]
MLPLLLLGTVVVAEDNSLSDAEISADWQLLFNGQDMSHWRNFKREISSDKWVIENGTMKLAGKGGGDILTRKAYRNVDLRLE